MITVKDHQTGRLFDPWDYLGPKRRKLLETSWAGVFRMHLFEKLPVGRVARHFNDCLGRPSKELYTAIGALILQQLHDFSDPEVTVTLAFNEQWHYALDITDESDNGKYLSERTLRTYRKILMDENLDKFLFETLTDTLIAAFGVDTSKQRLDSTHIQSNMRKLGRIRIFATTIRKFLKKLKRKHPDVFDTLVKPGFCDRYLGKESEGCFSRVKPSEAPMTLDGLAEDLLYLVKLFESHDAITRLPEYRLLERVLAEQCHVTSSGADTTVAVKPPKEVSPDSLQNPSDLDAGYDSHKGQGYQAQIMETYHDEKQDAPPPNLITYVDVEPANEHDANALQPAIEAVLTRECCPEELVCDTLYGGDDNVQEAAVKGVEVVAPLAGHAPSGDISLSDFTFDETTHFVTVCPEGNKPETVCRTRKNRIQARFTRNTCSACPYLKDCPVKLGKKAAFLRYDDRILRIAQRRVYEQTSEFKDRYRWRAGIEGTNSHLKSDLGAERLRVRGRAAVRFAVILKALGLNIMRCAQTLNARFLSSLTAIPSLRYSLPTLVCSLYDKFHILLANTKLSFCFGR